MRALEWKGIHLEVIWCDIDLLEVLFRCSNGYFSGQAEIYVSLSQAKDVAEAISGFPSNPTDSRRVEMGTFKPEHADGGARMYFHCVDSQAHAAVDIQIRGDGCKGLGELESVALRIPVEAAAIDRFARELRKIDGTIGTQASLPQAGCGR